MAKKVAKKVAKKPRNTRAQDATFINIDPLKRKVKSLEAVTKYLEDSIFRLVAQLNSLEDAIADIELKEETNEKPEDSVPSGTVSVVGDATDRADHD